MSNESMKITKKELLSMCVDESDLAHIESDIVDIAVLVETSSVEFLLSILRKKLSPSKLIRFAKDCALINVECLTKCAKYDEKKYKKIIEFLNSERWWFAPYRIELLMQDISDAHMAVEYAWMVAVATDLARLAESFELTQEHREYAFYYAKLAAERAISASRGDKKEVNALFIALFEQLTTHK